MNSEQIQTANKKIRYDWLDAIKALAITLVILGHLGLSGVKEYQVWASFIKLPLFFAASGFVFNPERTKEPWLFVKKRVTRLLLPYFYLCAIICVINYFLGDESFGTWLKESLHNVFTGSIYMWFLPVLFICNIMMLFIFKIFKNKDIQIIISAAVSLVLGFFLLPEEHILFNANVALVAYPFCVFGYYLKKYILKIKASYLILLPSSACCAIYSCR